MNLKDYHFEIKEEVVDYLRNYTQYDGYELCGVLTGIKVNEKTYRICKVSPPCIKTNSRCGCERDADMANQFLEEDYKVSEQTRTYIGEWHTHPESNPKPSSIDCRSIENNYITATHTTPFLIMIIVGMESLYYSVFNGNEFVMIEPKVV